MTGWFRRIVAVAVAVVVLGVAGCSGNQKGPVDPPVPSPTVRATGTLEEQILGQYRRFWTESLPAAEAADPTQRKEILAPVVMEPALSFLVEGIRQLDGTGQKLYGHAVPIGETVKRGRGIALVTGCLDSSHAGKKDANSGRILTRGSDREFALVTLKVGSDSVWRVYQTGLPEGRRC